MLPLQNRRFTKSEIHASKERLHLQTRLKRCMFFSFLGEKFKTICSLSLVRKLVLVLLLLFWFQTSTTNIHKTAKIANDNLTQDKHQYNNLLRRHTIDWSHFRRNNQESRHSNLSSATSKICHKVKKVCVDTSAENRIFGLYSQLCHPGTFFKQNKNSDSSFRMSEFVKQSTNINFGVDKVNWLVDVNYSSSFTSKVELSFPSNATNVIFIAKPFLYRQNCSGRKLKNQTKIVGTKLRTGHFSSINLTACRGINTDRCLNKGMGGMESQQGGMWSVQKIKNHINVLELLAIKLAIQTFLKTLKHKTIHLQEDNVVALTYLLKMGGTQNLKLVQLAKEIWDHTLQYGITLTAEYLPSKLNVTVD